MPSVLLRLINSPQVIEIRGIPGVSILIRKKSILNQFANPAV